MLKMNSLKIDLNRSYEIDPEMSALTSKPATAATTLKSKKSIAPESPVLIGYEGDGKEDPVPESNEVDEQVEEQVEERGEEEEEEEEEDQNQKEDVESFLSFAREPAFYYDKDLNQTVDLYVHLHANIKQQMDALKIDDVYFDSIVRSLYHHFYIRREVIYDKELLILIQHIVKHEYANKMDITPGEFIELTKELKKQSLTAKEMTSLTPSSSSYSSLTPVPLVQQTKKNYSPMNDVFNKMNTSRIPISQIGAHRFNSK